VTVRLNLAAGPVRFGDDWINVDLAPPAADQRDLLNVRADFLNGIPFRDGSAGVIYLSHFLEHLAPMEQTADFLKECRRILAPGGILRVSVPDFRKIACLYLSDPKEFYAEYDYRKPWFGRAHGWSHRLGISVMHGHKMLYDLASLTETLEAAGFEDVLEVIGSCGGHLPIDARTEILPTHLTHSVVVDAVRAA